MPDIKAELLRRQAIETAKAMRKHAEDLRRTADRLEAQADILQSEAE
jgi:hypothetical protein